MAPPNLTQPICTVEVGGAHAWVKHSQQALARGQRCLFALIIIKTDARSFISYWLKESSSN